MLFAFGKGEDGQIGRGDDSDELNPSLIEYLRGVHIKQLAAGYYHSAALTDEGLYVWGWGEHGQLGLGDRLNRHEPTLVNIPERLTVVACGSSHTACLSG